MTDQNNASPFIDSSSSSNNTQEPVSTPDNFSIRTMKDDLAAMQRGERPIISPTEIPPLQKNTSQTTAVPQQQTPPANSFGEQAATTISNTPTEQKVVDFVEISEPPKESSSDSGKTYKIILGAIVFFVIAIIGLGGYYFWITKNATTPIIESSPETIAEELPETAAPIMVPLEKYSSATPNYLSFDPAKEALLDLNKTLNLIAADLKEKASGSIYEFTIVDSNNNPVVFPIFAAAVKANISPALLDKLEENFSIFFYNDSGDIHLALNTTITDKNAVIAEMLKEEKNITTDASFLFLEPLPKTTIGNFGQGSYNGISTKYLNISEQPPLSIDYAITDSNLIIGTSKYTLRAVLDKLSTKNTSTTIQTPQTTTPTETVQPAPSQNMPAATAQ